MHPEDDLNLAKLIELLEKSIEDDKERQEDFTKFVAELKAALEAHEVPTPILGLINSLVLVIERVGKNRGNIDVTRYYLLTSLRNLRNEISDIHDTLAGLSKHR